MKIILIDDHALIRAAMISALVGSRFEVVAQASSVNEALAMINTHNPDIALVDINLGSATGIDLIKTAIKSGARCKFVVLTMHDDEQMLEQAKLAGASQITMVTRQKTRRDLAVTLGATDSVDPADNEVYLYSQGETAYIRKMYPCFDQPDLKATFQLTVTAPAHWEVISNSPRCEGLIALAF